MLSAQLHRKENRKTIKERYIHIVDVHLYMYAPVLLKKELFVWQAQALHGKHVKEICKCNGELPVCKSGTFLKGHV